MLRGTAGGLEFVFGNEAFEDVAAALRGRLGERPEFYRGSAASLICYGAVHLVKRVMVVDDALDVLGVHGVGGALGTLALPFLAGLGMGGNALNHPPLAQFLVQAEGVGAAALWSIVATFIITKVAMLLVGLRVDPEHETLGLDFAVHGETGYHMNR